MAKRITLTLYKSELIYDIQNQAHLIARAQVPPENVATVANVQIGDEEPDTNHLLRSIGDACAILIGKLSPYITEIVEARRDAEKHACRCHRKGPTPDTLIAQDNELMPMQDNGIEITLEMPNNFNHAFASVATAGMHGYVVNAALGEWLEKQLPDEAPRYYIKAEACVDEVRSSLNKRIMPLRRRLSVF